MSEKIGVCAGCGTRFRIPETYTGTSAKCKKCGGVVAISAAPGEPAAAAPRAAAPTSRPAPAAAPARAARTERPEPGARRSARAEAAEPATEGRRSRRGAAPEKKSNPMLLVGVIAGVLIVGGGVGFMLMNKKGAGDSPANAQQTPTDVSQKPATDPATPPADAGASGGAGPTKPVDPPSNPSAAPTPADASADPTPAAGDPAADPPKPDAGAEEPLMSKFEFASIEKAPGTTDEEWKQMTEIAEGLKSSGKARKRAMDKLLPFGMKAVPVLVSSLNGLDLTEQSRWMDGFEVATFIQDKLTAETILIPYHGDYSTDPKEVNRNHKVLNSIVEFWNTQARDPDRWEKFLKKYEEKKANKGKATGEE